MVGRISYSLSGQVASATFDKIPALITFDGWALSNPIAGFAVFDTTSGSVKYAGYKVIGECYTVSIKCSKSGAGYKITITTSAFNWNGLGYYAVF